MVSVEARLLALTVLLIAPTVAASVPWPAPPAGTDPNTYEDYLYLSTPAEVGAPNDYAGGDVWKYARHPSGFPEVDLDPTELNGVTGMRVDAAWTLSTGRPDVVIAVLDSGIRWQNGDLRLKAHLNTGELPLPEGATAYDADGNGVVNVDDYAGDSRVSDLNGNGHLDAGDLIRAFSDGIDGDGNGYVDDISGWNFLDDTNDPFDEVDYGHGTGEAEDSTGEAANGGGFPGVCPNCQFVPLRVGQSFIAHDVDYGRAVVYAVDLGAAVVQEALGTVDGTNVGAHAHRYAYDHGVPILASAADEAAQHHNLPSAHAYSIVVNSIRRYDDTTVTPRSYLYVNGCTNVGTNIWVSVSSTSCSSEATGRSAGVTGLLLSHARNQVARGLLTPHPGSAGWPSGNPLSAAEVRALIAGTAEDIALGPRPVVSPVPTIRYPSTPGWDPYTGWGRLNALALLERVQDGDIPPEATIHAPSWWEPLPPTLRTTMVAELRAWRSPEGATYRIEVGCTNHPLAWEPLDAGPLPEDGLVWKRELWNSQLESVCRVTGPHENLATVMLRATVTDGKGNTATDQRAIILAPDNGLHPHWPIQAGGSGESSPDVVDLDGDGLAEIIVSTASGYVHAYDHEGNELSGWPVQTDPHPAARGPGLSGVDVRISGSHGATAVADLDADGRPEVVLTTLQGVVYAWNHDGTPVSGWPVTIDYSFSDPAIRNRHNSVLPGIQAAPVLVNLDADPQLEVVVASMDRHVYAWNHDGTPFWTPVHLADPTRVTVAASTHAVTPRPGVQAYRGAQIVSTPAACDLDGDGAFELVVGSNEHYRETPAVSLSPLSFLLPNLLDAGNGRLYALRAGGSYVPGWPIPVPDLAAELLPYVGEGIPGSPACGDLDGDGKDEVAIYATAGPVMIYDGDGRGHLGTGPDGLPIGLTMEVPGAASGAADLPYLPAVGSVAIGAVTPGSAAVVAPAAGLGRALDVVLSGFQPLSQDYIAGWDTNTGIPLPAFPRPIEDLQFITTQALMDVDGDGLIDLVAVSAGGSLHAYDATTGAELPGFPKVTGHWMIGTPAAGDIDGDGLLELVATTREGWVWVWDLPAPADAARQWWSDHHDEANTGRWIRPAAPVPGPSLLAGLPLLALALLPLWRRR